MWSSLPVNAASLSRFPQANLGVCRRTSGCIEGFYLHGVRKCRLYNEEQIRLLAGTVGSCTPGSVPLPPSALVTQVSRHCPCPKGKAPGLAALDVTKAV